MKKVMLLAAVLLLNMLWSSTASALLFCSVSDSMMAFGSFSPLTGSEVVSTGNINVFCDALSSYSIALSPGGSGTYSQRRMASGGNFLEYNLYRDAGHSQVWGDDPGSMVTGSFLLGGSRDHTVYGRIPLSTQRGAMVGSYSDSITVTITY